MVDRDSAIVENPPIRNPTPELESSTAAVPPSDVEVDFNSEDDAALLECVQLDREADDLLNKMGEGAPPIYVTSLMLSFIVNFPLADRLNKIKLSTKKLFTLSDTIPSEDINWGDGTFGNPWLQEPQYRRGILVNLGLDPAHCTCDFCQSYCNPINLRPKGRGKIRVVQKVPGQTQPGILGFGAPPPLVPLKIVSGCHNKGARMATLCVTPDTGATVDVIKEDIAKQIGAEIEPNTGGYKLSDAQNAILKIVGTCKLRLQRPGGQWRTIKAMVTSKLSDSLLLSQKFLYLFIYITTPMNGCRLWFFA